MTPMYSKAPCGWQVKTANMQRHIERCKECRFNVYIDRCETKDRQRRAEVNAVLSFIPSLRGAQ